PPRGRPPAVDACRVAWSAANVRLPGLAGRGGRGGGQGSQDECMDSALTALLDELARFGDDNDARETERARRMLNITPETGRLLWILARSARATRILAVGTSNASPTNWPADAARAQAARTRTREGKPARVRHST